MPRESRRQALLEAKLRALVKVHGSVVRADSALPHVPAGAAGLATTDGACWFLAEDGVEHLLGSALVWLTRAGGTPRLAAPPGPGAEMLATRLAAFVDRPDLFLAGSELTPAPVPSIVEAARRAGALLAFDRAQFLAGIADLARPAAAAVLDAIGGLDAAAVELDHDGALVSVRGLEVARVNVDGEAVYLDVGVGRHDRAAHRAISGDHPVPPGGPVRLDTLQRAIEAVLEKRRAGAPEHQVRSLRAERWLRSRVIADPTLAGLPGWTDLVAVAPPLPVRDLTVRIAAPAVAAGEVVVCSTGIDLDAVPTAVHSWLQAGAARRLTLVLPARDEHPIHDGLVARLDPVLRARIVTVPDDWRAGDPH